MGRKFTKPSLWTITTPEAIAWSVCEFYQDPQEELQQRVQRARNESDDEAVMMFEAALHVLNTSGHPKTLRFARPKTGPQSPARRRTHG